MHYIADYLKRVVKKSTGLTLVEYGQLFRLQEAAALLIESDLSIYNVMSKSGFSNRSYFNKIFLRRGCGGFFFADLNKFILQYL